MLHILTTQVDLDHSSMLVSINPHPALSPPCSPSTVYSRFMAERTRFDPLWTGTWRYSNTQGSLMTCSRCMDGKSDGIPKGQAYYQGQSPLARSPPHEIFIRMRHVSVAV